MKRRKQIKRAALSTVVAGMVTAVTLAGGVAASAADATAFPTNTPDITSLLSEFYQWWAPKKLADPNNKNPQDSASNTAQGFAFRGNVTDAGISVLKQNDDIVEAINNKAAQDARNGAKAAGTHTPRRSVPASTPSTTTRTANFRMRWAAPSPAS